MLVVVAIIALLIAILLPSLRAAREQAKLTVCKANCKQIGTIIALYQTESAAFVPVLFNDAAPPGNTFQGPATNTPQRTMLMSVALRKYDARTRQMKKPEFDPETHWTFATRNLYEATVMPDFYVCPFEVGKGPRSVVSAGSKWISTPAGLTQVLLSEMHGRFESPQFGLRLQDAVRPPRTFESEFAGFNWNHLDDPDDPASWFGLTDARSNYLKNKSRRWTSSLARKHGAASLSEAYVSYCGSGQYMVTYGTHSLRNYKSHRMGSDGGTNAIFADTHVQWVNGIRIGSQ